MDSNLKNEYPKVGIGVIIMKDGKILLGRRKGSHGTDEYASPGGHLEYMEGFEECARREVREETGMEIENVRFLLLANIKQYSPKHYTHIGLLADWKNGEPRLMEPEKCEGWSWYDPLYLPSPLFGTMAISIEAMKTGRNYWDE